MGKFRLILSVPPPLVTLATSTFQQEVIKLRPLGSAEPLHPPQDRRARPGALRAWARADRGSGVLQRLAVSVWRWTGGARGAQIEGEVGQAQHVDRDESECWSPCEQIRTISSMLNWCATQQLSRISGLRGLVAASASL